MLLVMRDDRFPFTKGFRGACCTKFRFFPSLAYLSGILIRDVNVNVRPGDGHGGSDLFPSTHWSVVFAAGRTQFEPDIAHAALAELCQVYWAPLYSFVRSRGYTVHDAQDLTQSFFAFLLERRLYTRADRRKGRFRSLLLASIKNFLADAADKKRTLKRGGAQDFLPLHEAQAEEAEALFQTHSGTSNGDRLFDRSWAEALVCAGLERLSADYKRQGKEQLFNELRIFVAGGAEPPPTYAELADHLQITESTIRSHVTRLRARYRDALRAEVRRTVDTETQVDEELHELLHVLTEV